MDEGVGGGLWGDRRRAMRRLRMRRDSRHIHIGVGPRHAKARTHLLRPMPHVGEFVHGEGERVMGRWWRMLGVVEDSSCALTLGRWGL